MNESDTPIISIIVPVYCVEKYISKCLISIQKQSFTDFECIVVDDGTPDRSIEIGKQAVGNDERFIFVSKPNGGLASARNFGLDRVRGEYIAFVDSDDYVSIDFLEKPYLKLKEDKADICVFSAQCVDENYEKTKVLSPISNDYKDDILLTNGDIIGLLACSKMYKKTVVEKIRFDENIITYEDVTYAIQALYEKKLVFIKEPLYFYLQRVGSLSKDIKPTYLNDRLAIINFCENFYLEKTDKTVDDDYFIYAYLNFFVFHAIAKFAFYSTNYNYDIQRLGEVMDNSRLSFKNILMVLKKDKRAGLSLLVFKVSPSLFKFLASNYLKVR